MVDTGAIEGDMRKGCCLEIYACCYVAITSETNHIAMLST
jgi:hypothetical protein